MKARRRFGRRYTITLFLALALVGGWVWLWHFASDRAETTIDAWRAREARAGHIYACGTQAIAGFPFRIEVDCGQASAIFRGSQPPLELKAPRILAGVDIYDPQRVTSTFIGPLTIASPPGHAPEITANWKSMQTVVRGTPAAPESLSVALDHLHVDKLQGNVRQSLVTAARVTLDGRIAEGSAAKRPIIDVVLRLISASAPGLHAAAVQPMDADITAVLRGLSDFSPKPWPVRFREIQAAGGRIDITQAHVRQGETIAVGGGTLSLTANGRLDGQLRVTVAGIEPFLSAIGAQRAVENSKSMDKLAGALDRFAPGLGDVARQGASANLSLGINLLGEQTTLDGRRAVTLPLRFSDGAVFLGPIPIGTTPPLFERP